MQELVSAYRTKQDKYTKAQTKLSWKQDAWKEMNTKIYNFYSKSLSNMRRAGNFTNKKITTVSDSTKAKVTASSGVVNGTQTLKVNQLATAGYLTGKKLKITDEEGKEAKIDSKTTLSALGVKDGTLKIKVGSEEKTVEVKADMTISDFTKALQEQGVKANFDATQQRFFLFSEESGKSSDFNLVVDDADSLELAENLGLATKQNYEDVHGAGSATNDMVFADKLDATNAIIELNGAVFEGESNSFSINGLNITALSKSDEMTVTTATDVDGIYNMIKDFLKEYNEVVNAMESAYNAPTSKGYEPLTDSEKESMSDKEIEKWETKIKDSILRRDDTLRSVLSGMSMNMAKTFEVNGKKYSLASFGIKTAGYFNAAENESYAYHIDNDASDSVSSANEDRLRKMIEEDPDAVTGFFTQLATKVYDNLHERMTSNPTLSSAYKVYNDKQMKEEYDDYTKTIKKWEEKLKDMEDYYYKKFSAMETALAKLQSQTNSLSSLLGG